MAKNHLSSLLLYSLGEAKLFFKRENSFMFDHIRKTTRDTCLLLYGGFIPEQNVPLPMLFANYEICHFSVDSLRLLIKQRNDSFYVC